MKSILLSASARLLLLFFTGLCAGLHAQQSGQLLFVAHLTGDQEVPAVTTNAQGMLTVLINAERTKMQIQGVISGLSGAATAAHLHAAPAGQNGGVVVDLGPIRSGNKIAGELPCTPALLTQMLTVGIYANIHTAMHPGGEVRGQLRPESDLYFGGVLNGLAEVPPVAVTATGVGGLRVTLGHDKVQYRIVVNGLTGPITAAHIHAGAVGVAGPVVIGLGFVGNTLIGELPVSSLPVDFLNKLMNAQYYVNVHTAANPSGEVRAQLSFSGFLSGFALLNGDQETPPVTTNGIGIGGMTLLPTLDSLVYFLQVTGLSGPATAAHVHKAPAGTAGGVVFGLNAVPLVNGLYTATVALDSARISDFIKGDWYFNVHTAANPSGEIRGQIQTNLRKSYAFELCGAQEVPPVSGTAYGGGMVSVDQDNLTARYQLAVDGLSGPATAAHIHTGMAGVNGGVLFALQTPTPYSEGAIAITGNDAVLIANAGAYMNVHTTANPGGAIRGQVVRALQCSASSAVFDPAIGSVKVFPNPVSDVVCLQFESREAFSGRLRLSAPSGQLMLEQAVEALGASWQEWTLPLGQLAPGLYYLSLIRDGQTALVQPVVKK